MSKKQETVADIVAELRAEAAKWHAETIMHTWMMDYARRIEAAWKREKAEIETFALEAAAIMEVKRHTGNETREFFAKLADPLPKEDYLRAVYMRLKARFEPQQKLKL